MGHLHWCSNVSPDDFDWAKEFNEITGQPKDKAKIFLQSIPTPTTKLVKKMRNLAVIVQGNQLLKKAFYEKDFSIIDDPKYQYAGKTGTSQVKRITEAERELDLETYQIPYKDRDHAWFVAFGPYKEPRYALSVLVEHGGSGSKAAAPIAKKLFKLIIDRHELREKTTNQKGVKV